MGELARNVTALRSAVETGFRDVHAKIARTVVQRDVYDAESKERDRAIAESQRRLTRFYGFLAALAVTVVGSVITSSAAVLVVFLSRVIH